MNAPQQTRVVEEALAVLISGGLDSAILLGEALRRHAAVYPLYVRGGLHWEAVELQHLARLLAALRCASLRELTILDCPVTELYGTHWSLDGRNVPDADSPDEAVFLPGRNVLLLSQSMIWCHVHGVAAVALAPLASNPFPDATSAFFATFAQIVNQGLNGRVAVHLPYAGLHKTEVMRRGLELPLDLTFSCIQPRNGLHCGRCNKCGERRRAFADAGLDDHTVYAAR